MKLGELTYSGQAKAVMEKLQDNSFDIEKFEEWVLNTQFVVGGGHVLSYLEYLKLKEEQDGLG